MSKNRKAFFPLLRRVTQLYGVQSAHYDVFHHRQAASPEGLLYALRALGAPVESFQDVPNALREKRQSVWQRCVEPVTVAWDGSSVDLPLRLESDRASGFVRCEWELETGGGERCSFDLRKLPSQSDSSVEGVRYLVKLLKLRGGLPWGYHRLSLELGDRRFETTVISAPSGSYSPNEKRRSRVWGVSLPLYALHSKRSWGAGDLSDLESLFDWIANLGGRVIGTLPVLASFLDEPFDASPYAPASRLFWNEFYVDVTRVPELERSPAAQSLLASADVAKELDGLRTLPLVDYRRQIALKRKVLWELAHCMFAQQPTRSEAFRRFVDSNPAVEDYAHFRAVCERRRAPWTEWPSPERDGVLTAHDYEEAARRYHIYVQWVAHDQLQTIAGRARSQGQSLYLDLPLGVHPASFDVWLQRDVFAIDASGGAPPDAVFVNGQNWNFPPLHPQRIREQGYGYFVACLRHQLALASMLRIDHIMGLHRLFWIPKGLEPKQGVYVRYHAEEFYAIVSLESHRNKAEIVGENLGTVPSYVNAAMSRHNIQGMYVVQYELSPEHRKALKTVPANAVASLNTHDMPPFAAFLRGLDLEDRLALELLNQEEVQAERETREAVKTALGVYLRRQGWLKGPSYEDTGALTRGCLEWLANSRARVALVNLEDLWGETQPQNVPGTLDSRPNWRKKAHHSLEEFGRMPEVLKTLGEINRLRNSQRGLP